MALAWRSCEYLAEQLQERRALMADADLTSAGC